MRSVEILVVPRVGVCGWCGAKLGAVACLISAPHYVSCLRRTATTMSATAGYCERLDPPIEAVQRERLLAQRELFVTQM